jgi:hypothetical protein
MSEHPTPECPNCGAERTRPLDDEWATCFVCDDAWMMTEKTQKEVASQQSKGVDTDSNRDDP